MIAHVKTSPIDVREIANTRKLTTFAVIEERRGAESLRTEVLRNNKTESHFCRACNDTDCRHITAVRRKSRLRFEVLR